MKKFFLFFFLVFYLTLCSIAQILDGTEYETYMPFANLRSYIIHEMPKQDYKYFKKPAHFTEAMYQDVIKTGAKGYKQELEKICEEIGTITITNVPFELGRFLPEQAVYQVNFALEHAHNYNEHTFEIIPNGNIWEKEVGGYSATGGNKLGLFLPVAIKDYEKFTSDVRVSGLRAEMTFFVKFDIDHKPLSKYYKYETPKPDKVTWYFSVIKVKLYRRNELVYTWY